MNSIIFPACYRKAPSVVDIHKSPNLLNCFRCKGFHRWGQEERVTLGICTRRSALRQFFSTSATLTCVDSNSQNSPARKLKLAEVQRHCPRGHVQCNTKAFTQKNHPPSISFHFGHISPIFMLLGVISDSLFLHDLSHSRICFWHDLRPPQMARRCSILSVMNELARWNWERREREGW